MRFRLRTLLVVLAVVPVMLAGVWVLAEPVLRKRWDQSADFHYARSMSALKSGRIFDRMGEEAFLREFRPFATHRVGAFTVFDLGRPNGYYGCTVIARDGRLIHAKYSECVPAANRVYFTSLTPDEVSKIYRSIPEP